MFEGKYTFLLYSILLPQNGRYNFPFHTKLYNLALGCFSHLIYTLQLQPSWLPQLCSHLTIHILSHLPLQSCSRLLLYIKLPSSTHLCSLQPSVLCIAALFSCCHLLIHSCSNLLFHSCSHFGDHNCNHLLFHNWSRLLLLQPSSTVKLPRSSIALKGTQDWEFFWLRFWILCYFIGSYAQILRFCKKKIWSGHYWGRYSYSA